MLLSKVTNSIIITETIPWKQPGVNGDGSRLQFTSSKISNKISNVSVLELEKFSEVFGKLRSNLGLHDISF